MASLTFAKKEAMKYVPGEATLKDRQKSNTGSQGFSDFRFQDSILICTLQITIPMDHLLSYKLASPTTTGDTIQEDSPGQSISQD